MKKQYAQFIIYSTTVLVVKLAYDYLMTILPVVKSTKSPYLDVLIGMVLTLILFIPLYDIVHNALKGKIDTYIETSKKFHKKQMVGMTVGYILMLIVLFGCFVKLKFDINIITEILKKVGIK